MYSYILCFLYFTSMYSSFGMLTAYILHYSINSSKIAHKIAAAKNITNSKTKYPTIRITRLSLFNNGILLFIPR